MTTTSTPPSYLTDEQIGKLLEAIHPGRVAVLDGLSHLEAYDVRAHLTRIFGFGRWGEKVLDLTELYALPTQTKNGKEAVKVAYRATVRLAVCAPDGTPLAEFDGAAVGESIMPEFKRGDAYDMAVKTSCSQALKRAAIDLGDQFGLSLYRNGSKDPLVIRLYSGHQPGQPPAKAVEPDVVPEGQHPDAIGADELAGEPAPPPAPPRAEPAWNPEWPSREQMVINIRAAAADRLDAVEEWLINHGLADVTEGEFTFGEHVRARRDQLRDELRETAKKTRAHPTPAPAAEVGPLGIPRQPLGAPDDPGTCGGRSRQPLLEALAERGVTEAMLAEHFGRPLEQVGTQRIAAANIASITAARAGEAA